MPKRVIIWTVVLVAIFLIGFVPAYTRANSLQSELDTAQHELNMARLRDQVSLTYFEAADKNYGLAIETSTRFFDRVRELAPRVNPAAREAFNGLLGYRDKITASLAKADPAALDQLRDLYAKTRQATGTALRQ